MITKNIIEKANKYNYIISQHYIDLINWLDNVESIDIDRDREKICELFELEKDVDNFEIQWLIKNYNELSFDIQCEDKGFAFVDILTIYHKSDLLTEFWFYGDGEAQNFIDTLIN